MKVSTRLSPEWGPFRGFKESPREKKCTSDPMHRYSQERKHTVFGWGDIHGKWPSGGNVLSHIKGYVYVK